MTLTLASELVLDAAPDVAGSASAVATTATAAMETERDTVAFRRRDGVTHRETDPFPGVATLTPH
jgi:hypothetical protein